MMRRLILIAALSALIIAVLPAAASATSRDGGRFAIVDARMTGAEEVPDAVDTKAKGRAVFVIDRERETVRYVAGAWRIDGVTEAHIHLAPKGANGPPVAFLFDFDDEPLNVGVTEDGTRRGFFARGVITADDLLSTVPGLTMADFIDALTSGEAYVNVHTLDFRPGEIRGQIG